ncbi:MAG: TetR/AcrR family transcriptional regulator [Pseudolysinimonas sp.]|uniref:TetR/AcrR family transcriptional regulator n=1 Tax=Pseudolysinimonas sp. TaxID=2680009 RepID=UPI003265DB71
MGRPLTPLLSVELIAETALKLIDSGEPFSMRRLAKRLGVSAPALYNHVESKDALVELLRGSMVAAHPVPKEEPGTWVDRVAVIARAQRAAYSAHPHVVPLLIGVPIAQPAVLEAYRELARALASAGFKDAEVSVLLEVIDSFAIGNALEQGVPQQIWVDPDDEGALARAMGSWSDPRALLNEAFETGLEFILDGMQNRLRNRQPGAE